MLGKRIIMVSSKVAVFVDRDGTICYDKHYLAEVNELQIIPTVADGISRLNKAGIKVVIVTNQSGIARGRFDERRLDEIHERLKEILWAEGAKIDDLFFCPHMPDAGCRCRKPAPGMMLDASKKHNIDLRTSFVIGDRMMDIEMAHKVGSKAILVPEPGDQYDVESEKRISKERPDYQTDTFLRAVEWILSQMEPG